MKVAVWDTYVKKEDGNVMHFDIIVSEDITEESVVFKYGEEYIASIQENGKIAAEECQYCHIEKPSEEIISSIEKKGYYILEMEKIPKSLSEPSTRREMILFLKAHYPMYRFENFKGIGEEEVREKLKLATNKAI